jgi:tetratricopeptide (TPR) repeat protein
MLEALSIYRGLPDPESMQIAHTLGLLGLIYRSIGDLEQAILHLSEALAGKREHMREGHIGLTSSMGYLALALKEHGDYERAEALFKEALSSHRGSGGDERLTANFALSLGETNLLMGRAEESLLYLDESLAIHKEKGKTANPRATGRIARLQALRAEALLLAGPTQQACLQPAKDSLAIYQSLSPLGGPEIDHADLILSRCLLSLGRRTEAEARARTLYGRLIEREGLGDLKLQEETQTLLENLSGASTRKQPGSH